MIRRLPGTILALLAVLAVSLTWTQPVSAYDPSVKPQPWAYEKGLIAPEFLSLRDGLVGHWVMWEGAGAPRDISGNGNHGTFPGGTADPTWTTSIRGLALDFDGSDDYVDVGDPSDGSLDFGTTSFTLSVWFRSSDTDSFALNKRASNVVAGYDVLIGKGATPGVVSIRIEDGAENRAESSTWTGTDDGEWHHVVGIVDRSADLLRILGDGVEIGSGTDTSAVGSVSNSTSLNIGARQGSTNYQGLIDDVRIYNRALTNEESRLLYLAPFGDVWPEYSQQPTDVSVEEAAAAPQIIIISVIFSSLAMLAYYRRKHAAKLH